MRFKSQKMRTIKIFDTTFIVDNLVGWEAREDNTVLIVYTAPEIFYFAFETIEDRDEAANLLKKSVKENR